MIDSMLYNLTQTEIENMQQCHEMALRKLLSLPSKTPKQMLYILTGSVPIKYLIQRRRLNYLHKILNKDDESLLKTFFETQLKMRKTKDWENQITKDLNEYKLNYKMDEKRNIPDNLWKLNIKEISIKNALIFLNSNQGSKSQKDGELKIFAYLCPNALL